MSASPQNNNNDEGESKESELVHRSTASASASADIKLPGGPQTKQSPSTVSPQQDPHDQDDDDQQQQQQQQQDEPKGQTHSDEGPATAEDDSIMQGHPATQEQAQYETEVKEQDRWLPIANVARIMKTALPDNAKIAKEAKECMQECVSEFISFITSEASEKCQHEKRKTVNGEDIIFAMTSLGFENYSEALRIYLVRYRESNLGKAEGQQPGHGRSSTPGQQGQTSSGDEREEAVSGVIGATVPSAVPGGGMAPSFGGAQESDPTGAATGVPYAYPAMSNGGSGTY